MADARIKITVDDAQARRALGGIDNALQGVNSSAGLATRALGAFAAAFSVRALYNYTDGLQAMTNKIRIAIGAHGNMSEAMNFVNQIADKTGQSLESTGDLYAAVARNAEKLGYNTDQVATVTNAMATALYASGTNATAANSVMYQFSQILAKGKVNGDEFTTIMENLGGPVMDLIARNMGVTTAELVQLKEKGLIGAKDFTDALIKSMEELDGMAGQAIPTLSQSLQRVTNSFGTMLLEFEKSTGFFNAVSEALQFVARNMNIVVSVVGGLAAGFAAAKFVTIAANIMKIATAFRAAAVAGTIFQCVTGIGLIKLAVGAGATAIAIKELNDMFDANVESGDNVNRTLEEAAANSNNLANGASDAATQLTGVTQKYDEIINQLNLQLEASQGNTDQQRINNRVLMYANQLQGQATDEQLEQIRNLVTLIDQNKELAKTQEDNLKTLKNAQEALDEATLATQYELERLNILNLDLREEQAAVDAKRLELGELFTAEMEEQIRLQVKQAQANRQLLETEKLRLLLAGQAKQQTGAEQVSTVAGVVGRTDPRLAAEQNYQTELAAIKANEVLTEAQKLDLIARLNEEHQNKLNQLYIQGEAKKNAMKEQSIQAEQMRLGKTAEEAQTYAKFEMKTTAEKTQFAIEQAGNAFTALGKYNKTAFEAAKAFNIANAIMNTYMGATKALASYPPPFNFIAAAAVVASGLAQVAQIRSQTYSGRQLGGPVMGGGSYIVGENGPEIFSPTTNGSITRNGDIGKGGDVNVNFTIVANDTTGFDELLTSREDLIRGIISDAMEERGQRSLV